MGSAAPPARSAGVFWRRRAAAFTLLFAALAIVVAVAIGALNGGSDDTAAGGGESSREGGSADSAQEAPPPPTLPNGERTIFPSHRVIAFYGNPAAHELGILGIGSPDARARQLKRQAKGYGRKSRPVLPALELISTIANADPGDNGLYRSRMPDRTIRRYLRAARKAKALLLLDIQPGRSDFFEETTRLRKWLKEPDVGLALDPEWRVQEGQIPGQVIGSVTAREVNATTAWLDRLVRRLNLPQKLVVIHQFTMDMISERENLKARKGLAITLNADGFGTQANKLSKYKAFTRGPKVFGRGYKLFYKEDTDLMTPGEVMRMRPRPDFIVYE
jgi:hypothetical protein